jgi:large subunit ribosomal protein L35
MAKQKLKTRKSMAKRIKITASGKVLHMKGARNHKRLAKAPRTLRMLSKMFPFTPGYARRARRMAPYKKHLR